MHSRKASKVLSEAELRSTPECKQNSPDPKFVFKLSELFLQAQRRRSWYQDARTCRLTGFEVAVRLGGVLERVALPDFDIYFAGEHDVEEVL